MSPIRPQLSVATTSTITGHSAEPIYQAVVKVSM